jgi:hypothetical protein
MYWWWWSRAVQGMRCLRWLGFGVELRGWSGAVSFGLWALSWDRFVLSPGFGAGLRVLGCGTLRGVVRRSFSFGGFRFVGRWGLVLDLW